jgi:hypothetical protein
MQYPILKVDSSPLALVMAVDINTISYMPCDRAEWEEDAVMMIVRPLDKTDEPFMSSLKLSSTVILAHRLEVALCSMQRIKSIFTADGGPSWEIRAVKKRRDFNQTWEMSFAGTSADQLAELRARRLLLNESPARESRDINEITRELFVGGHETLIRIERSPFPELYKHYRSDPLRFLHVAWITGVMQLLLSGTVGEIHRLELSLTDSVLSVVFKGKRRKQYQNVEAYEISVTGRLILN